MKKADRHLTSGLLLISAVFFLWFYNTRESGAEVLVMIDQKEVARLPLEENQTFQISSDLGNNLLVIKDGIARVTEADCPDKICVNNYAAGIRYNGESIICLPHRVVVSIIGGEENPLGLD